MHLPLRHCLTNQTVPAGMRNFLQGISTRLRNSTSAPCLHRPSKKARRGEEAHQVEGTGPVEDAASDCSTGAIGATRVWVRQELCGGGGLLHAIETAYFRGSGSRFIGGPDLGELAIVGAQGFVEYLRAECFGVGTRCVSLCTCWNSASHWPK